MSVHAQYCGIEGVDTYAVIVQIDSSASKFVAIQFEALTGTREENTAFIVSSIQNAFDTKIPLTSLPTDDPARLSDPNLEIMFWDETQMFLVTRVYVVMSADWTDPPGIYNLTLRDARFVPRSEP